MKRALQQELFPAPPPPQREARPMSKRRERQLITWHRGCSREFQARGFGRHRLACMFSRLAWPVVVVFAEVPRVA